MNTIGDKKEDLIQIGNTLRILRDGKNLNQPELAIQIGVDKQRISQWENGTRKIPFKYLKKYSEFFNVSIDSILTGKDFTPQEEKGNDLESMSYADLIGMIRQLEKYQIIRNAGKSAAYKDYDSIHYGYNINDRVLNFLILSYRRMDTLLVDGNINKNLMKIWESGIRDQFNYHLINWSKIPNDYYNVLPQDEYSLLNDAENIDILLSEFSKRM